MKSRVSKTLSASAAIALATTLLGGVASAAPPPAANNSWTLDVRWRYLDSNQYWGFDESRMGQKTNLLFYCNIKGKTAPGAEEQVISHKWPAIQVEYGKKATYEIKTESEVTVNGQKYVDVNVGPCFHYMWDGDGFARDLDTSVSEDATTRVQEVTIQQIANTDFQFALTEGKIHPDDRGTAVGQTTVPITIGLNKTYKGQTAAHKLKNGELAENTYNFADKAVHHPSAEYANGKETPITRGASGNEYDLYSFYTGKYQSFKLTAKFGNGKTKTDDGRYEIQSVTGDETTGWTVNVKSNVKERTPEAPTVTASTEVGVLGTVNIPVEADPANPVWKYEQVKVNKAGQEDPNGTFVKVTASLVDPVLNYIPEGTTTEWTLNVSPKAATLTPAKPIAKAPNWNDTRTPADTSVTIPLDGGKVQPGTTVTATGPGTATLNPDGSITVKPDAGAKAGDVIKVVVLDPSGNVIDEITVTLDPVKAKKVKKKGLPQTGMNGGIGVLSIAALGVAGLAVARLRKV